jgi:phosphoglycerol transferase
MIRIHTPDKYKSFLNFPPVVTLLILSMLVFIFLIFRNMGLYPAVFEDEYHYTKFSRLLPFSEAHYPNYIYFFLYRLTSYCGHGFLECARIMNALFFVAAMPFIYSISRRVAGQGISIFVSFLAVMGPVNSYTAYFMPESLYFLCFWIFAWYLLRPDIDTLLKLSNWLILGVILGFISLVKPHAIFLFPAIILYIIYIFLKQKIFWAGKCALSVILLIASALTIKYAVSYAIAGASGLTLLGPGYGLIIEYGSARDYSHLLILSLFSLRGHLMVISILYGLPLTLMLLTAVQGSKSAIADDSAESSLEKICAFSLFLLITLLCVTALFTAAIAYSDSIESPSRLHVRYYSFMLPFLYIIAAGFFKMKDIKFDHRLRYVFGALIVLLAFYGLITNLAPYLQSFIDCPEIFWSNTALWVMLLLPLLLLWIVAGHIGVRLYLLFSLPVTIFASSFNVAAMQRDRLVRNIGDEAGVFAAEFLPKEDLGKMIIAGSSFEQINRARYQAGNPDVTLGFIKKGEPVNPDELPKDREWLLLIDDQILPGKYYQIQRRVFTLASLKQEKIVDFKKNWWPGIISRASGLSYPENWGTCSDGDAVTLKFTTPLPGRFKVRLVAAAFGPNVGKDFIARSDAREIKFVLDRKSVV